MSTQLKAIAFDSDIAKLTENFTGRQWVFDDIDRWLKESDERFFILTGEPGVGKSAIAARLTQIRNDIAAYHFCRANDVETVRPARILRSLAAQLGEHLTDYGQALANTIKPIHLRVEVNITIGSMTGSQVTGVYIENLKESDPGNELDILIRAPLEELQRMYTERQQAQPTLAIILIDSLDESVTTTGTNLVKLLTQLSKSTSLPSWVRFVMTSRPERRVLRGFEPLKPYHLQEKSDESLADVRRYVEDRVDQPALQDQLQDSQVQPQTLINEITRLSQGNFLYTTLLLNDIEAGRQALDNLAALPKSIDDFYHGFLSRFSEEDWRDRYKPIFGVLTVAQEPISEKQISNFTKIDSEDVRDSIRIARQFFDVELDEQNKETYAIFHQSLRDYLLDEDRNADFWCNEKKQHQRIIDFCKTTSKSWQELERIDAYGRKHLAQHLVKGDRVEEFHMLLSLEKDGKNAWFKVKDDEGDTAGFLADTELAWSQADEAYEREPEKNIGLQCRYALIKTSINSLAGIPKEFMVALVRHQYWKPAKVLAYVSQVPDSKERVESLVALSNYLPNTEPIKHQALHTALQTALTIKDDLDRARVLTFLADKLPSDLLPQVLKAVLSIQDSFSIAKALTALADKLTPDLLPQAFKAVLDIKKESDLFKALIALADKLPPELLPQALSRALNIKNEYYRAMALTALAVDLPQALTTAQNIQEDWERAEALTALADKLPPKLLPHALKVAQKFSSDYYRAKVLAALASIFPQVIAEAKALAEAQDIHDPSSNSCDVLTALADRLPEYLPRALDAAQSIQYGFSCAHSLEILADKLPPELLLQAIEVALLIQDEETARNRALTALADKLPPELFPQAIQNEAFRAWALRYRVDILPPELLPQALEVALATQDIVNRTFALTALTDKLPEIIPQVLASVLAIFDKSKRTTALGKLADRLPPELLPKALEAAQSIQDEKSRAETLTALADKLPKTLPEALKAAQAIQHEYFRFEALMALAHRFPEALSDAFATALAIQIPQSDHTDFYRAQSLIAIADRLPPELLPQALKAVLNIQDESDKANALIALSNRLPPELLPIALQSAQDIGEEEYRVNVLTALSNRLPSELLPQALKAAQAICDPFCRVKVLTSLVDRLPEVLPEALATVQDIENQAFCARSLASLADKLPPELLSSAYTIALSIESGESRAEALTSLADRLPEVFPQALKAVLNIQTDHGKADALKALADRLPPEFLPQALKAAQDIGDDESRVRALVALVDKLPPEFLPQVLTSAKKIHPRYSRATLLSTLADKLPEAIPEALKAIQDLRDDPRLHFTRATLLTTLADKLPEIFPEALEAAQNIPDEEQRAIALTTLVDKLPPELLPQAIRAAQDIQVGYCRAKALTPLIRSLDNDLNRFDLWKDLLHSLSFRTRPELLKDITALLPIIFDLGGETALAEISQAIQNVSHWWT